MGYFRIWESFLGKMCLNLRFIPLFSLLYLVFACFKFVCEIELNKSKCMNRGKIFEALKIKEACKEGQKTQHG